jgi:hypothetical protein
MFCSAEVLHKKDEYKRVVSLRSRFSEVRAVKWRPIVRWSQKPD